jgi:hypothetical protein
MISKERSGPNWVILPLQSFQKRERELDLCNDNPSKSCLESHPLFKVPI